MALTSCTTPAAGRPTFEIGPDEMEFGVGIHGEPGRRREQIRPAHEIVREMADAILAELAPAGPRVLAFVNGLGGTPLGELYLVYDELAQVLDPLGIEISRSLVGSYVTSLDMTGASITLLTLDDELLAGGMRRSRRQPSAGAADGQIDDDGRGDATGAGSRRPRGSSPSNAPI